MVLSGGLSNHHFKDLLQCLTSHKPRKAAAKREASAIGGSEARRKFGTVGGAVIAVLAEAAGEMRVKLIHAEVERRLGGRVSRFSVADYLRRRSKGARPMFVRTRPGHYRLARRKGD